MGRQSQQEAQQSGGLAAVAPHSKGGSPVRSSLQAPVQLPAQEERAWVAALCRISASACSPGFGSVTVPGDPAAPNANLARRVIDFCQVVATRWPLLGEPSLVPLPGAGSTLRVDPHCDFWAKGRNRYLQALDSYIRFLEISQPESQEALRRELLADLGFHIHEEFVAEAEEAALLRHWSPGAPAFGQGCEEAGSRRRFFHYGPVLQRRTERSRKSALGVVPCRFGAMPPPVVAMDLAGRIRAKAAGLGDRALGLDQLYVNYYSASARACIDFHHDNPKSMRGLVAGLSLASACELHLLALDPELGQRSIVVHLPRRSLYLMSGLSRYHLQHGIPAVRADRLSLTFRSVDRDCEDRALWRREWGRLPPEEVANAHWPMLPPE